jgi:hypothetical protein
MTGWQRADVSRKRTFHDNDHDSKFRECDGCISVASQLLVSQFTASTSLSGRTRRLHRLTDPGTHRTSYGNSGGNNGGTNSLALNTAQEGLGEAPVSRSAAANERMSTRRTAGATCAPSIILQVLKKAQVQFRGTSLMWVRFHCHRQPRTLRTHVWLRSPVHSACAQWSELTHQPRRGSAGDMFQPFCCTEVLSMSQTSPVTVSRCRRGRAVRPEGACCGGSRMLHGSRGTWLPAREQVLCVFWRTSLHASCACGTRRRAQPVTHAPRCTHHSATIDPPAAFRCSPLPAPPQHPAVIWHTARPLDTCALRLSFTRIASALHSQHGVLEPLAWTTAATDRARIF